MITILIVEVDGQRERGLNLKTPRTIDEVWGLFAQLGQRPVAIYVSRNVARVVF